MTGQQRNEIFPFRQVSHAFLRLQGLRFGNGQEENKLKRKKVYVHSENRAEQLVKTASKGRLDEVEKEIHDKRSRHNSIEHYLTILEEKKEPITEYDAFLWHGMVEYVTVYSKDDIRFTMKDGTEIRA